MVEAPRPEQEHEEDKILKTAGLELKSYGESLKFGTPRFRKLSNSAAIIDAGADLDSVKATEMRFSVLGNATPEMIQEIQARKVDEIIRLRIVEAKERECEDTVEGYYQELSRFNNLHSILSKAEEVRFQRNPPKRIVSLSDLRNNPTAVTIPEAAAEVAKRVANTLKRVRTEVLQKGSEL